MSVILPKALPLISDKSDGVRTQLLELFKALPPGDIGSHVEEILPHIRVGITSLATEIRISSLDVFEWVLEACGDDVVSCAGGWVKPLKCLVTILGWSRQLDTGGWSSYKPTHDITGSQSKLFVKTLNVMAAFVRVGLEKPPPVEEKPSRFHWTLRHLEPHMIPRVSNPYGYLNLFGPPRDEESREYPNRAERQRSFRKLFQPEIESGIEAVKKAEGEIGRAAAGLQLVISEGMRDYEEFDY